MNKHYKKEKLTGTFTGIGWTKTIIELMITIHINEWYLQCQLNSKPNTINHNDKIISFEKEALLITIQHLHKTSENLTRQRKEWFRSSVEDYDRLNVTQLRQWIQNTKKLFKYEKLHQHNTTKITDYFNYNITDTHPKNRQKFKNNTSNLNTSTVVNNNNQYKHNKRTDTKNNNIEIIDKNSVNGKDIRNQSRNEVLVNDNSNNMVQIQKEQLENRNIISTYESINNHNNKYKQKDIYENKNNTTIVRNPNPSIDSSEVIIPQKRDNESLNNDYEMGTGTYNTTQNKFAQKTKSPESEFHTQEQRGRERSESIIKNIGIIKRTEKEEISSKNNSIESDWKQSITSSETNIKTVKNIKKNKVTGNRSEIKKTLRNIERLNIKRYAKNIQKYLDRRSKFPINTREKRNVKIRSIYYKNKSYPTQNLRNIVKTKMRKRKITATKNTYIRCSKKIPCPVKKKRCSSRE